MKNISLKKIAIGLLLIPILFIGMFLVGEVSGGDISGWSHLIQLLPFLLIIWMASKWPRVAGYILVGLSLLGGTLYFTNVKWELITLVLLESILFLIPLLSGILLILSSRTSKK